MASSSSTPQNYAFPPSGPQSDASQRLAQQPIQQGSGQTPSAFSSVQTQVPQQYLQAYQQPQIVSPGQVQLQQATLQMSSTAFQGQQMQESYKAQPVPIAQGMPTIGPQMTQQAHIRDTETQPPVVQTPKKATHESKELLNRLSSSPVVQMPKKAIHKSKEYIQNHPGGTRVFVSGAFIAADILGVKISSDIAAASKLCDAIQSSQQHKQNAENAAQSSVTTKSENAAPTQQIPQDQRTHVSPNPPIVSDSAKQAFHQLGHPNSQQGHIHQNHYQHNAHPGTILQQIAHQQSPFPQSPPQYPPQKSLPAQLTPQLDFSQQIELLTNPSSQFSQAQYYQPQDPSQQTAQPQEFSQTNNYPGDQSGQFSLQQTYNDPNTCNYDATSNIPPLDQVGSQINTHTSC